MEQQGAAEHTGLACRLVSTSITALRHFEANHHANLPDELEPGEARSVLCRARELAGSYSPQIRRGDEHPADHQGIWK